MNPDSVDLYQNATVIKIQNGTDREDSNLCGSCRYSHIYTEAARGEKTVLCRYDRPIQMRGPISACNKHSDKNRPSLDDMNEIAWQLQTNKGGRSLGFLSPEELKNRGRASGAGFME